MKNTTKNKRRILLAAPGEQVEGGIASMVLGLKKALNHLSEQVEYKMIPYAKTKRGLNYFQRILLEMYQFLFFNGALLFYNPHMVHVQSSFDKKTVLRDSIHLWMVRLFRKKFILHAHGGEWHLVTKWSKIWRRYTDWFLTRCNLIIVTSTDEQKIIESIYGQKVNVCKIYNPVILPINLNGSRDINPSYPIKKIIFASRFIETKGILDAVRSMHYLPRNDFKLYIFGNGILWNEALSVAKELGVQEKIAFMNEVPLEELIKQYLHSDIFIFPSYHLEGFPMALFYAVICGMAVVTTHVRPATDFLSEPDNCLWIEPKNPKMLAEKLEYLLDREPLRQTMSLNNQKLAELFTADKVAAQLIKTYDKVIQN